MGYELEDYEKGLSELTRKFEEGKTKLGIDFAKANNSVLIGDYVSDSIGIIKVRKISFHYGLRYCPECIYSGVRHTKTMKPFKTCEIVRVSQGNMKKHLRMVEDKLVSVL